HRHVLLDHRNVALVVADMDGAAIAHILPIVNRHVKAVSRVLVAVGMRSGRERQGEGDEGSEKGESSHGCSSVSKVGRRGGGEVSWLLGCGVSRFRGLAGGDFAAARGAGI